MKRDFADLAIQQWAAMRPELDGRGLHIVSRILRLAKMLEQQADDALAACGLALWQFDVLAALRRSGPPHQLSPTDLLQAVTLSSGAMTNRIDRLEAAGYVVREADPDDRRGVLIRLTEQGIAVADRAIGPRMAQALESCGVLSEQEFDTLSNLLRVLLAAQEGSAPRRARAARQAR